VSSECNRTRATASKRPYRAETTHTDLPFRAGMTSLDRASLAVLKDAPRVSPLDPISDGVVTLRRPSEDDRASFRTGRDDEFRRWLGAGTDDPRPTAAIVVDAQVVGWIDYDADRAWLKAGEVNVGYALFPSYRGYGYASRAVELLLRYLAGSTAFDTATLLIEPANTRSLAVAQRTHFEGHGEVNGGRYFKRSLPSR
jgi:RimJ/RimL family protein N-acetyltransferase